MAATRSAGSRRSRRARSPSGKASARDLPVGAGGLLGRAEQVSQLVELLGRARLVTLTGAPGIGKSRLAVRVAEELGDGKAGATRLVELAPIARPVDVPRAVASALSVEEVSGQDLADTLIARLSNRRLLLVLDNCEHLVSACASLVERLLCECPEVSVLATSREPLGLAAETVWQVAPLAVPTPHEEPVPEALGSYPAVVLFVERARAVQPGFALNAHVAPSVGEICRRLDGIPLAIELAAARVESLTADEVARRLDDRFALLKRAGSGQPARHHTLEAALDWSHALLSDPERALLRRLSVFSGGFDIEAAQAVCSGGEVGPREIAELLRRLVAKSLVVANVDETPPRYRLLETIRAYAGVQLDEAGEGAALRDRHAGCYLELAEQAEPELTGGAQGRRLDHLEAERANLRCALEWSISRGEGEQALRLAGALVLFWRVRCHFSEGRELLEAALSAGDAAPAALRAKALWGAGFMALMSGDSDAAVASLEQSLSRFRALGNTQGCARALLILGSCRQHQGLAALPLLEESAALARTAGDSWCLAHALGVAGLECCLRDEPDAARPLLEECITVAREADDKQGLRFGLLGLGEVAGRQGDYRSAELLLEEALAVARDLGEDYTSATALLHLSQCAIGRGDYPTARESLDEALALLREVKPDELIAPLVCRAHVAQAEGDRPHTRRLLEEALTRGRGGAHGLPSALLAMGRLVAEEGNTPAARRMLEEAVDLARAAGDKRQAAGALSVLGGLSRADGELKRAAVLYNEALALQRGIGDRAGLAASLEALGGVAAAAGRGDAAARLLGAGRAIRRAGGGTGVLSEPPSHGRDVDLIREQLCDQEVEAAFAGGAGLSIEEVSALASKGWGSLGRPVNGWESLTESECQVAELVAEGMTNPEIAEVLLVSRSTVRNHLSRIFSKLGIERRTELVRELSQRRSQRPRSAG